jgi:hypothetical protein
MKRITKSQFTVAPKPNQGTNPKKGCHFFRVCFFGTFLHKQKSTININLQVFNDKYNFLANK